MVTIQNLEVRFDVEGDSDEAAFGKLFEKYAGVWDRKKTEEKARRRFSELERSLGDRNPEGVD